MSPVINHSLLKAAQSKAVIARYLGDGRMWQGELTEKIEQLLAICKNETGYAERLKEEAKTLNERAAVINNKVDNIMAYIAASMEMMGKKKIRAGIHQVTVRAPVAWVNPEDSKSNRAIGVALNDTACKVLRDQIGNHHKWVFVHMKAGVRPDGSKTPSVRKMRVDDQSAWNAACRRAGIEDFRFHDLRHTWASWLIQSGVPLSVLQEMGGWESIEMVRRYAHLAPNHLTEHAKQIDSIFGLDVPNMSHSGNQEGVKEA